MSSTLKIVLLIVALQFCLMRETLASVTGLAVELGASKTSSYSFDNDIDSDISDLKLRDNSFNRYDAAFVFSGSVSDQLLFRASYFQASPKFSSDTENVNLEYSGIVAEVEYYPFTSEFTWLYISLGGGQTELKQKRNTVTSDNEGNVDAGTLVRAGIGVFVPVISHVALGINGMYDYNWLGGSNKFVTSSFGINLRIGSF